MIDELDDLDVWDDPETLTLEPLSELVTSGDRWEWVGRTGRELESWEPILTTRLREKLHPVEIAYYERRDVWQKLMSHAARKIGWQPAVGGWTQEDIAQDALEAVTPLGFEVGGASWVKMTRRVMNNRVSKLLASQTVRAVTTIYDYSHDRSESPEFIPQVFSGELCDWIAENCSASEAQALILTYQEDYTSEQVAEEMKCSPSTVRTLLERGRLKLRVMQSPL